ncbi:HK97 family phage prohead protease [Acaricomes phytoseiuli]|uniref:HK97 family phage prohead protease n=1 Tax=Acaricomes phytoseiuli TaxID=291968 RepID=UPI002221CCE9|nr:HK97 family phage prohead protease [Acaricomes phytoseiuli]MCW1249655.1 HK97 family phage prohead protease [Acaricomes phytoseiuli]
MRTKSLTADIKAAPEENGIFTGYASVFGNVDSYGDRVTKGAFEKSLATYGENGAGIPCYWSHQMSDPMKCIGQTVGAKEDERGLLVRVQLDMDNPVAQQTHRLIKAGLVKQMSFAFDVEDFAIVKEGDRQVYELRELKIHEVSVVQVGANQETELLDVKERLTSVKAGRKISAQNEDRLTKAAGLISEVLGSLEDESRTSVEEPGKSQEPQATDTPLVKTLSAVDIAEMELTLLKGAI